MTGIIVPIAMGVNLILATFVGYIVGQVWVDLPVWALLVIGVLVFCVSLYLQDFIIRSKTQSDVFTALRKMYDSQGKMLNEIDGIKELLPGIDLEQFEKADPKEFSKAVLAEIRFIRSLMDQISEYHEKITGEGSESATITHNTEENTAGSSGSTSEEEAKAAERAKLLTSIKGAIKSDRIEMLLQPIVSLPQRKRRHCECFSRIKDEDGEIIVPENYLEIAKDEKLISIIDNTLVFRSVQMLRKALKKSYSMNFFCNIAIESLKSKKFSEGIIEFFNGDPRLGRHIIFELDDRRLKQEMNELFPTLEFLANNGCRFSLEGIENLKDVDLKLLKKGGFAFIKIEVKQLMKFIAEQDGRKMVKEFKKEADKLEIDVILTKIEEENQLVELLDFHIDYGQGYLFGAPSLGNY